MSWPARGVVLVGVPLLLLPLAACAGEAEGEPEEISAVAARVVPYDPPVGAIPPLGRGTPSEDETGAQSGGGAAPDDGPGGTKAEGGGVVTAVPDSDRPGRKADVGPQYRVTEDLDIEEIERLVAAVERITKRQRLGQPQVTGGSVAAAVGTFSYRWFADGTVRPDPAWVAANIRTEPVPILGNVTAHKVMLPQLRGALREVVARGLADEIHPEEFGGSYVPRFIGRDPAKGLSLHTWGIAIDLNVPGNLRGVPGEIDRDVVAIFKKWGFAWGGDWSWTDPMHFELARLVRSR